MTKFCSYCLNTPRLTVPVGVIPDGSRYFDCPVCQENRISASSEDELVEEPDFDEDELEDFNEDDFEEYFDEDDDELGED